MDGKTYGLSEGGPDFSDWNLGEGHGPLDSVAALSESFGGTSDGSLSEGTGAYASDASMEDGDGNVSDPDGADLLDGAVAAAVESALRVFSSAADVLGGAERSPDLCRVRAPETASALDCAAAIAGSVGIGDRRFSDFLAVGGHEAAVALLPEREEEIRRLAAWIAASDGTLQADDDTLILWAVRAELLAEGSEEVGYEEAAAAGKAFGRSLLAARGGKEPSFPPRLARDDAGDGWAAFTGAARPEAVIRAACAVLGRPLPDFGSGTDAESAKAALAGVVGCGAAEAAAEAAGWDPDADGAGNGPAPGLRAAAGALLGAAVGLQWRAGLRDLAVRGLLGSTAAILSGGVGSRRTKACLDKALWMLGRIPEAGPEAFDGETAVVLDHIEFTDSEADGSEWEDLANLYSRLLSPIPVLALAKTPDEIAAALSEEFPWAEDAIAAVRRELSLAVRLGLKRLRLPPLLLVGPPACGKSRFARRLAELAGAPSMGVGAAAGADSFAVAGVGRAWRGRQPSLPAIAMNRFNAANPVLVVEEIDKAGEGREYGSLQDSLLTLLDPETSSHWPDPCLLGNLDASRCCWIATANDLAGISAPLASRFLVLRFPRPKVEHVDGVVGKMLASIAKEFGVPAAAVEAAADIDESDRAEFRKAWMRGMDLRELCGIVRRRISDGHRNPIPPGPGILHFSKP